MFLLVGLGNPGDQYARTRHNVGFMVVDAIVERSGENWKADGNALVWRGRLHRHSVLCVKPQTYMNCSGEAVGRLARYWKVETEQVIVIHDELDVEFGQLRCKAGGGTAGHNGLKSISAHLNDSDFLRVRVGIGRPPHMQFSVSRWVLSPFSSEEQGGLSEVIDTATAMVEGLLSQSLAQVQQRFHRR